jgi:sensor domain DACNV-containing protein
MTERAYPAARHVAARVREHFLHHLGTNVPSDLEPPALADIEAIVDAGFWASLRREEGYVPKISLALVAPERVSQPIHFKTPLALSTTPLTKVAPAVERPGIHLGVWRIGDELRVWGTTRAIPAFIMVLEVAAPGLLVIKHHRGDGGKFVNVAVLEGDQVKIIDEHASQLPDCPAMLTTLLGFDSPGSNSSRVNVLVDLAVSMRAHNRGGIILMVPSVGDDWRQSIVHPVPYAIDPVFTGLAELLRRADAEHEEREWQEELEDLVHHVAGLTAVDGATILNDRCEVLGFGAKITRRKGSPLVEECGVTEPIEDGQAAIVNPAVLGGTRHLAAAQFVYDQRNAVAMVASQDGRFTVFIWSPCEERVHAHRVETLLL